MKKMRPSPFIPAVLTALLFFSILICPALASSPVILDQGKGKYQLGPYLSILEDASGKLTINDVLKPESGGRFAPAKEPVPNYGFSKSAIWVKFSVTNPFSEKQHLILEDAYPHHDRVTSYIFLPGADMRMVEAGDAAAFADRDVAYRNILFLLDIPAQTTAAVYMRFKSESSMQLPLTLWKPSVLLEKVNREQTFLGMYFGLMLGMLVYNLFLFGFLKDGNYLYYALYIGTFVLAQMGVSRFDIEYLWPNHPTFANLSHPVFFNLTFFFGCLFCKRFLDTKKNVPRIDKIILVLMGVSIIGVALSLLVGYTAGIMCVALVSAFFVPIVLMTAGIVCWAKGITMARYFTLGWATFLLGAVLFNLRNTGVLPSIFITDFSPHIGSAIEVVLLSLALADRINVIEKDKRNAQAQALKAERALAEALEKQVAEKNSDIQTLSGLLPICASCKKIRDDKGYWQQVENYLSERSDAQFTHGICPDCLRELYPDIADRLLKRSEGRTDLPDE